METRPLVGTAWGFPHPDVTTSEILDVLRLGYRIRVVGALRGSILVQGSFSLDLMREPAVFSLTDNGGEIMVAVVNSLEPARAVPVTEHRLPLTSSTIAYRVAMALRGDVIDYTYRPDDLLDALRESLPSSTLGASNAYA